MAKTVEEYIQHHAVSGCLTIEDRQYIELQDVRKLIQMVLDEQKETEKEQRRRILDEKAIGYLFLKSETDGQLGLTDKSYTLRLPKFKDGCGLHPFTYYKNRVYHNPFALGMRKGFEVMTSVKWDAMPAMLAGDGKTIDSRDVAMLILTEQVGWMLVWMETDIHYQAIIGAAGFRVSCLSKYPSISIEVPEGGFEKLCVE